MYEQCQDAVGLNSRCSLSEERQAQVRVIVNQGGLTCRVYHRRKSRKVQIWGMNETVAQMCFSEETSVTARKYDVFS